jgi:hypothetical protein
MKLNSRTIPEIPVVINMKLVDQIFLLYGIHLSLCYMGYHFNKSTSANHIARHEQPRLDELFWHALLLLELLHEDQSEVCVEDCVECRYKSDYYAYVYPSGSVGFIM